MAMVLTAYVPPMWDLPANLLFSDIITAGGSDGCIMIFTQTNILTDKELKKLKEHVYSSSCASLLDPLMQKYWNWWATTSR